MVWGILLCALVLALVPPSSVGGMPQDAVRRAELLERGIASQIRFVRKEELPWAISIEVDDVNAWLSTRLPKWIAHDPALKQLEAASDLVLCASRRGLCIVRPVGPFSLSVVLRLAVIADGVAPRLRVEGVSAAIGRLPLPGIGAWLLGQTLDPSLEAQVAQGAAVSFDLGDGRRVELIDVETTEGSISLRFRTLKSTTDASSRTILPQK